LTTFAVLTVKATVITVCTPLALITGSATTFAVLTIHTSTTVIAFLTFFAFYATLTILAFYASRTTRTVITVITALTILAFLTTRAVLAVLTVLTAIAIYAFPTTRAFIAVITVFLTSLAIYAVDAVLAVFTSFAIHAVDAIHAVLTTLAVNAVDVSVLIGDRGDSFIDVVVGFHGLKSLYGKKFAFCVGVRYLRHTRADNWNRSALRVCWGLAIGGAFASPLLLGDKAVGDCVIEATLCKHVAIRSTASHFVGNCPHELLRAFENVNHAAKGECRKSLNVCDGVDEDTLFTSVKSNVHCQSVCREEFGEAVVLNELKGEVESENLTIPSMNPVVVLNVLISEIAEIGFCRGVTGCTERLESESFFWVVDCAFGSHVTLDKFAFGHLADGFTVGVDEIGNGLVRHGFFSLKVSGLSLTR
jgi:hypothetical protein